MSNVNESIIELAVAQSRARSSSAEASQNRAEVQGRALDIIHESVRDGVNPKVLHGLLVGQGILRGTSSKMTTVLRAINNGMTLEPGTRSLYKAYKQASAYLNPPATTPLPDQESITTAEVFPETGHVCPEPVTLVPSPDEALGIILDKIRGAGDVDAVFSAAGDWITKITEAITGLTREAELEEL